MEQRFERLRRCGGKAGIKPAVKIRIGEYDCWVLPDGEFTYPGSTVLPPEGNPPTQVSVPYTAVLVDTGPVRVLLDTGAGPLGPNTGRLPESLAAAGFSPEDIHTVVLTHGHPDHIADLQWLSTSAIVLMRKEFEFWTDPETQARLQAGELYGLGRLEQLMAASVRDHLVPARERMRLIDHPTEVAAGILIFPAPGHTPGHAAVLISSGRQQLLYVGDAIINPAQFEHPEWVSAFDLSHDQTIDTRRKLLDRAAADRCISRGLSSSRRRLQGGTLAVELPLAAGTGSGLGAVMCR